MAVNRTLAASGLPEAAVLLLTEVLKRIGDKSAERRAFKLQKDIDRWEAKEAKGMVKFFEGLMKSPISPLMKRLATEKRYPEMSEAEIQTLFPD